MKRLPSLALSLVFAFASTLSAQTVYVDFGRTAYQTTGQSDFWNNFHQSDGYRFPGAGSDGDLPALLTNMTDIDGNATTWSLVATGWTNLGRSGPNAGLGGVDYTTSTVDYPQSAFRDAIYSSGGMQFELQGLQPNSLYEITFFAGASTGTARRDTHWRIGGEYVSGNTFTGGIDLFVNPEGNNVVRTATVSSDSNGVISWWWYTLSSPSGSNQAALMNTLTVTAVPEPSSALLLVGAFLLVFRRRRS